MHDRRFAPHTVLIAALALAAWAPASARRAAPLPERLTNQEFWRLTTDLSEESGYFRSDNLLSNEMVFARVLPLLAQRVKRGGVYLGVGPEQNFTYLAELRPKVAFIVDIRRGNLHTQLMYKALFDLSDDREAFVARLFTKARPERLGAGATARQLMESAWNLPSGDEAAFTRNLQAIQEVLEGKYQLPLSPADREGIAYVYHSFYWYGPGITWSSSANGSSGGRATYKDLMVQTDGTGQYLSYLASEERFRYLKDLQQRNLVVPVVGNFAGPKTLRAIGEFLRQRDAVVSAFYLSNVEQYLRQDGIWDRFCANVAALPLDEQSVFIRPSGGGLRTATVSRPDSGAGAGLITLVGPGYAASPVMPMLPEAQGCAAGTALAPAVR